MPVACPARPGLAARSTCLVCLALMWLESVLGVCLGREIREQLVRRGWARPGPRARGGAGRRGKAEFTKGTEPSSIRPGHALITWG